MITAILIDWLEEGRIPNYALTPGEGVSKNFHLRYRPRQDQNWNIIGDESSWDSRLDRGVAWCPNDTCGEGLVLSQFVPGWILQIQTLLQELGLEDQEFTLVCPLRGSWEMEADPRTLEPLRTLRRLGVRPHEAGLTRFAGIQRIIVGFGLSLLQGRIDRATSLLPEENVAEIVVDYLLGAQGRNTETLHPAIRETLGREMRRRAELDRMEAERRAADAVADAKAKRLLVAMLTSEQCAEVEAHGHFHVTLPDGRVFRISNGRQHNVHLMDAGQTVVEYCITTTGYVPIFDTMLAQKLLLEADPERFFKIANYYLVAA